MLKNQKKKKKSNNVECWVNSTRKDKYKRTRQNEPNLEGKTLNLLHIPCNFFTLFLQATPADALKSCFIFESPHPRLSEPAGFFHFSISGKPGFLSKRFI